MDCFKIFKGQFTGTHPFLFDANTLWKKSQFDPEHHPFWLETSLPTPIWQGPC